MSPSLKQLNMRAYKRLHGTSVIPKGCYCYHSMKISNRKTKDGLPIFETEICPYWDTDETKPNQSDGYCWYMECGDWEEDGTFLLWDQVKECGENEPDYDPCEEE